MSTDHLRDALHRIGEDAPVVDVDRDTWSRARRARTRDRALGLVAGAAVVAVLAGALAWLPTRVETPVAANGGAVPSTIWSTPEDVPSEAGLAVGRASVAYAAPVGANLRAVVVGARDGGYHPLELPGYIGLSDLADASYRSLTLSPDGHRLAYVFVGTPPRSAGDPTPVASGVRVLDLGTGELRSIPLTGGQGVLVRAVSWSPDSRWLVWSGQVATRWVRQGASFGDREAAGLIAPGAPTSLPLPEPQNTDEVTEYAVADTGAVAILTSREVTFWDGGATVPDPVQVADRNSYAMAGDYRDGSVVDLRAAYRGVDYRMARHDSQEASGGMPAELRDRRLAVAGWTRDRQAVVQSSPLEEHGAHPALEVLTLEDDGTVSSREVAALDGSLGSLSVATDLMTAAQPTADLPAPDWVDTGHPTWVWVLAGLGALLLGGLTLAFVFAARRRRGLR